MKTYFLVSNYQRSRHVPNESITRQGNYTWLPLIYLVLWSMNIHMIALDICHARSPVLLCKCTWRFHKCLSVPMFFTEMSITDPSILVSSFPKESFSSTIIKYWMTILEWNEYKKTEKSSYVIRVVCPYTSFIRGTVNKNYFSWFSLVESGTTCLSSRCTMHDNCKRSYGHNYVVCES